MCVHLEMPLTKDGRLLRRHGDEVQNLPGSYYRALGRCDVCIYSVCIGVVEYIYLCIGHDELGWYKSVVY